MRDLTKLAVAKERAGAESGAYPRNWVEIARWIKEENGYCCERCGHPHANHPWVLTVHHLDQDKWNMWHWNLAALCQRCHLRIQAKVSFYLDTLTGIHSPWMARHVAEYNRWAEMFGKPRLKLTATRDRSYANEWD